MKNVLFSNKKPSRQCIWYEITEVCGSARLISGSKKRKHITPILRQFHWLPISYRIHYKIMVLVYKALEGSGPAYLQELPKAYKPNCSLRSSGDPSLLVVPTSRLKSFEDRGFYAVAPLQWNHLPQDIHCSESLFSFKSCLKTHYFEEHFSIYDWDCDFFILVLF